MLEFGRHCRFDLTPGQPSCQDCQGILQVDHDVNSTAEKVNGLHTKIPQKVSLLLTFSGGLGAHNLYKKASVYAGRRGFSWPTTYQPGSRSAETANQASSNRR